MSEKGHQGKEGNSRKGGGCYGIVGGIITRHKDGGRGKKHREEVKRDRWREKYEKPYGNLAHGRHFLAISMQQDIESSPQFCEHNFSFCIVGI